MWLVTVLAAGVVNVAVWRAYLWLWGVHVGPYHVRWRDRRLTVTRSGQVICSLRESEG